MVGGNFWTEKEIDILKRESPRRTIKELAVLFPQRSYYAVEHKVSRMKLRNKEGRYWKRWRKASKVKKLSDFWRGYVAGIIDGEGSINICKHGGGLHPKVTVGNTNSFLIRELVEITGVGTPLFSHRTKRWNPVWRWQVTSKVDVKTLLDQLKDDLIVKREQAILILKFLDEYFARPSYGEWTAKMMEIYKKLKELNQRGLKDG